MPVALRSLNKKLCCFLLFSAVILYLQRKTYVYDDRTKNDFIYVYNHPRFYKGYICINTQKANVYAEAKSKSLIKPYSLSKIQANFSIFSLRNYNYSSK